MREKFGADEIVLDEPYLPFLLVRAQLRYLRRMAKLEQRLQEAKAAPLYPDCCASYKDNDVSVPAQIEAETNRAAIEAKQDMDSARQQSFGVKGYIWRADGESCPVCAPRDGKIFTWGEGEAPGSIHPNCNCFAEPVAEGAGDSTPPRITGADIADMALLLASLIPAVRASRIGSAAVRGLGRVGQRVLDRARGGEKPPEAPKPQGKPIDERPKNVPKNWEKVPSKKGDGVKYVDPKNKGNDIRIQKGNPDSQYPNQRSEYVKWKRNGQWLDKNGKPIRGKDPGRSPEAHIPIEEFNFDLEIFK